MRGGGGGGGGGVRFSDIMAVGPAHVCQWCLGT